MTQGLLYRADPLSIMSFFKAIYCLGWLRLKKLEGRIVSGKGKSVSNIIDDQIICMKKQSTLKNPHRPDCLVEVAHCIKLLLDLPLLRLNNRLTASPWVTKNVEYG
jgi:hypothetical protein